MVILYPIMMILALLSLVVVLLLCVFPTMMCMLFGVCIYYCIAEDPIPLSVLLRYMLSPEGDPNFQPHPHISPKTLERGEVEAKLLIRTVTDVKDVTSIETDQVEYSRGHPGPIHIVSESRCISFSTLQVYEEKSKDIDDEIEGSLARDQQDSREHESLSIPTTLQPEASVDIPQNADSRRGQEEADIELVGIARRDAVQSSNCNEDKSPHLSSSNDQQADAHNRSGDCSLHESVVEQSSRSDSLNCQDHGTSCDVCLLEFEVGDEIAWSPNLDCVHMFHKECILDWLVRKPTCPNCRNNYLEANPEHNV